MGKDPFHREFDNLFTCSNLKIDFMVNNYVLGCSDYNLRSQLQFIMLQLSSRLWQSGIGKFGTVGQYSLLQ